jgi:hypothetical protein
MIQPNKGTQNLINKTRPIKYCVPGIEPETSGVRHGNLMGVAFLPALFPIVVNGGSSENNSKNGDTYQQKYSTPYRIHLFDSFLKKVSNYTQNYIASKTDKQGYPVNFFTNDLSNDQSSEGQIGEIHKLFSEENSLSPVQHGQNSIMKGKGCQDENT